MHLRKRTEISTILEYSARCKGGSFPRVADADLTRGARVGTASRCADSQLHMTLAFLAARPQLTRDQSTERRGRQRRPRRCFRESRGRVGERPWHRRLGHVLRTRCIVPPGWDRPPVELGNVWSRGVIKNNQHPYISLHVCIFVNPEPAVSHTLPIGWKGTRTGQKEPNDARTRGLNNLTAAPTPAAELPRLA